MPFPRKALWVRGQGVSPEKSVLERNDTCTGLYRQLNSGVNHTSSDGFFLSARLPPPPTVQRRGLAEVERYILRCELHFFAAFFCLFRTNLISSQGKFPPQQQQHHIISYCKYLLWSRRGKGAAERGLALMGRGAKERQRRAQYPVGCQYMVAFSRTMYNNNTRFTTRYGTPSRLKLLCIGTGTGNAHVFCVLYLAHSAQRTAIPQVLECIATRDKAHARYTGYRTWLPRTSSP